MENEKNGAGEELRETEAEEKIEEQVKEDNVTEVSDEPEAGSETLFASSGKVSGNDAKKPGMIKKQKILIISFVSVFAVLCVLYFAVIAPLVAKRSEVTEEPPPELLEGEEYDTDGMSILIFPHIEKKDMKSIEIYNSYGHFKVYRETDNNFYIENHVQLPISPDSLSTLIVDTGYAAVSRRITTDCEDLSVYGLAPEDDPAYYVVTTNEGTEYKLYIGDQIPSSGGFYAKYEGRNAVYVVPSTVMSTILIPYETLVAPLLGYPLDQNKYAMTDEFLMMKNGEPFVYIKYVPHDSKELIISTYDMVYPGNYVVNDDNYSAVLLYSLCDLEGYSVVAAGSQDNYLRDNEEIMSKYGFYDLKNVPVEFYYTYNGVTSVIAFAPSGTEGYYFAYSYLYDMIVLIEEEKVEYVGWDLKEFVNSSLFAEYIINVDEISVSGNLKKDGKVYNVDEKFRFRQVTTENNSTTLECYAYSTGKTFTGSRSLLNPVQSFYGSALGMKLQGYIKTESIDISELDEYASMTVKLLDGTVTEYKFYRYSERCFYTVNGEGEFYMPLKQINKVLIDAVRSARGYTVDSYEEYPSLPEGYTGA